MALPKYNLEWCQNYAKQHKGECLSKEYLGRTVKLLYRCEKGHEFYATPAVHIHKNLGVMNVAIEMLHIPMNLLRNL
ncbi:hypothetical protein [Acinetobacter radioresistens]|uniref:hypothetical protein n=1 Tax=Acinetobacter radioresistens TaxID=40216 RepID=UPI001E34C276|nr:hypothetical protein [Acinetobacter radioresistens]